MADTKYGNLVKTLSFRPGMGGANAKELTFVGGDELGGMDLNFIVGVYDQTGDWAPNRGAHEHTFDECLLFFGYDDEDMSYLGADMSLAVGKEREKHHFSVPTVVAAPRGVPHCPLVTEKGMHRSTRYNAYAFEINKLATKADVRRAVEDLFEVKVIKGRTQNRKGKPRRSRFRFGYTKDWKKAVVTLDSEYRIDFF